jgi:hypothetical protein
MQNYIQQYWSGKQVSVTELVQAVAESVKGTYTTSTVVNPKGGNTKRIVIEYEDPSDN